MGLAEILTLSPTTADFLSNIGALCILPLALLGSRSINRIFTILSMLLLKARKIITSKMVVAGIPTYLWTMGDSHLPIWGHLRIKLSTPSLGAISTHHRWGDRLQTQAWIPGIRGRPTFLWTGKILFQDRKTKLCWVLLAKTKRLWAVSYPSQNGCSPTSRETLLRTCFKLRDMGSGQTLKKLSEETIETDIFPDAEELLATKFTLLIDL